MRINVWKRMACAGLIGAVALSGCAKEKATPQDQIKLLQKIPVCDLVAKAEMEAIVGVALAEPKHDTTASASPPSCSYISASEKLSEFLSVSVMLLPTQDSDPKKAYDVFLNGAGGLLKQFPDAKIAPVEGLGSPAFWYEDLQQFYVFTPVMAFVITGRSGKSLAQANQIHTGDKQKDC